MVKKLVFDTNDELWNLVLKFKIDKKLKNNNKAVENLIRKGLEADSVEKQ